MHKCRVLPQSQPDATGTDMTKTLTILGIESSCDDTAAAVVRQVDGVPKVLSSIVFGQTELHADFGGVVPETRRVHMSRN